MAGLGALPQFTDPSASQVGQQGPQYTTPMQQAMPQSASMGYAVGDLYGAVEKAKMQNVTNAAAFNKAARDRVSQIWEMGARNPQMQQDPRVKQQVDQLYKQMGMPTPVVNGNLDWDSLRPAQSINDLSAQSLTMLQQASPQARRSMGHALGLIGVGDEFYNAPAQLAPTQKTAVLNDYSRMVMGGGAKGMTASGFRNWVETNRNNLEQAVGPGAADTILADPNMFAQMQQEATVNLDRMVAQTAHMKGMDARLRTQMINDQAQAHRANTLADLQTIRTQYVGAQLSAMPQAIQDKHNLVQSQIQHNKDLATGIAARIQQTGQGGTDSALARDLRALVASDTAAYDTASRNYTSALNSNGSVPAELDTAMTEAQKQLDTDRAALKQYGSLSDTRIRIANTAGGVTGNNTQPAHPGSQWIPTMKWKASNGRQIGLNKAGTGYVYADGTPYTP